MIRHTVPLFLALLAVGSCSKSASNNNSQGTLSAVVGSSNFNASLTYGTYFSSFGTLDIIGIVPLAKDSDIIWLTLPWPPPVNRAFSTDTTAYQLSWYTRSGSKSYDAFSGNGHALVSLSRFDSTTHGITGTFSGTLINDVNPNDSLVITAGKFNTAYTAE